MRRINISEPTSKPIVTLKKVRQTSKHHENIKNILLNSNATPIRTQSSKGYLCCFCNEGFLDPGDLKKHNLANHDDYTKANFMKNHPASNYIVKLDITLLQCKLCNDTFTQLDDFNDHLMSYHKKIFHKDIKNHIVPFKFETEKITCACCGKMYNNFKVLLEHMNDHFPNYVCESCGRGFVNKKTQQTHSYRHEQGEFVCSYCQKLFNNRVNLKFHERAVHVLSNKRNKCCYCGEMFKDYTKKNDHEVQFHGVKAIVLKCLACDRAYSNQRALSIHTKNYHLMQKKKFTSC